MIKFNIPINMQFESENIANARIFLGNLAGILRNHGIEIKIDSEKERLFNEGDLCERII